MMKQLPCYSDQFRGEFEKVDKIGIMLELNRSMQTVLSNGAVGLVKIVCEEEAKDLQGTSLMTPLQKRAEELSKVVDIHCATAKNPEYMGSVQLPDGYLVLADGRSYICSLYDSSYNLITSHILPGNPYGMCLIGDNDVAIAMPPKKKFQFLFITDHSIRDTGTLTTKYNYYGVDAVSREEIVVSGLFGVNLLGGGEKCCWCLITRNGIVKFDHEFESHYTCYAYTAVDMSMSRVYISVSGDNTVHCFGLTDGKQYFVYVSNDLKDPRGIAVDREGNIYVDYYFVHKVYKYHQRRR